MQTLATIVAYASGFALMRYHESPANLLATSLAVDASLAPLTVIVAMRRGRAATLWAIIRIPLRPVGLYRGAADR